MASVQKKERMMWSILCSKLGISVDTAFNHRPDIMPATVYYVEETANGLDDIESVYSYDNADPLEFYDQGEISVHGYDDGESSDTDTVIAQQQDEDFDY